MSFTWECKRCSLVNPSQSGSCAACGAFNVVQATPVGHSLASWNCSSCTFLNHRPAQRCKVCSSARPDTTPDYTITTASIAPSTWKCPACTVINSSIRSSCSVCGSAQPNIVNTAAIPSWTSTPATWICAACSFRNNSLMTACEMCQQPRYQTSSTSNEAKKQIRRQLSNADGFDEPRHHTPAARKGEGGKLQLAADAIRTALAGALTSLAGAPSGMMCMDGLAIDRSAPTFILPGNFPEASSEPQAMFGVQERWSSEIKRLCAGLSKTIVLRGLFTEASGDCLMHALCLGLCGVHDRTLGSPYDVDLVSVKLSTGAVQRHSRSRAILRDALFSTLSRCDALRSVITRVEGADALNCEVKWASRPRSRLTAISVFALSNMLRRPIVCFNASAKELAQCNNILSMADVTGIYVPTLIPVALRWRDPLVIGYADDHFVALVPQMAGQIGQTVKEAKAEPAFAQTNFSASKISTPGVATGAVEPATLADASTLTSPPLPSPSVPPSPSPSVPPPSSPLVVGVPVIDTDVKGVVVVADLGDNPQHKSTAQVSSPLSSKVMQVPLWQRVPGGQTQRLSLSRFCSNANLREFCCVTPTSQGPTMRWCVSSGGSALKDLNEKTKMYTDLLKNVFDKRK